jgi:HEAT repeat protein
MCSIQFIRYQLVRRRGIAVLTATLLCAGLGLADRFPPDPVEQLHLAFRPSATDRNLIQRVEALRNLGDMRRALSLQEWGSMLGSPGELGDAERQALRLLVDRFKKGVREVLSHGSTDGRLAAMVMLAEMGPSIRSPNPEDQNGIARTFAPDLVALIEKGDTAPIIKETAARTLGLIFPNPDVALPAFRTLYESGKLEERRAAANGLAGLMRTAGQLGSKLGTTELPVERSETMREIIQAARDVVPLASRGLDDSDFGVRQLSADAILQAAAAFYSQVPRPPTSDEAAELPSERLKEENRRALLPVMEVFEKQTPALGKALNDPDPEVRSLTARALEQLGGARQRLTHAQVSPPAPAVPPRPRGASLRLERLIPVAMRSQEAAPPDPLLEMLRNLLPILAARVADPNVRVRLEAIDVLETMESTAAPAVPALARALGDPDLFVRWAAARTLGKMGPVEPALVVPPMARLLFDPDLNVRLAAALALDRIGPAAQAAVPALIRATKASDALEREAAIRTLGGIGTGAQPAVPALAAALSDVDHHVRQVAAEVLGRFGSLAASAEPALRKALVDPDEDVRKAASDALLNILQAK